MTAAITADRLTWSARAKRIIDDISLVVQPGETVGLLGPNGSGKSTLIRVLAGLRRPDSGQVRLGDTQIKDVSKKALARQIALVEQEVRSDLDLLVRNVIELGRIPHRQSWAPTSAHDRAVIEQCAELTEISDRLGQTYQTLSGGERQRVQIARALAQEPDLLLLDEPTNHLDVRHQLALMELIQQMPVTSLVALHDLNLAAAYCDRIFLLQRGKIVSGGSPAEVLTRQRIADVYGVDAQVLHDGEGVHIRFLGALN